MKSRLVTALLVIVGSLGLLPAPLAAAAADEVVIQAGPSYRYCVTPNFRGEVRFWYAYSQSGGLVYYVGRIDYRIWAADAADRPRREADIDWRDEEVEFSKDDGLQDGVWRQIPTWGDYRRDHGEVEVEFHFDDDGWPDPSCDINWSM